MTKQQKKKNPQQKNDSNGTGLSGLWGRLSTDAKNVFLFIFAVVVILFLLDIWRNNSPDLAKFVAYLVGGALLVFQIHVTNRRAAATEETAKAMQKTAELTEQGNIAERFKDAIAHLGHKSASIRLGGIYALHHIAKEESNYRKRVFEILCAHIRETTTQGEYKPQKIVYYGKPTDIVKPSIEIESVLDLLFKRESEREIYEGFKSQLGYADLRGAELIALKLKDAKLRFTNLEDAQLYRANLQGAQLVGANLEGANFAVAIMIKTNLTNVTNLTIEQLLEARTLYKAKLPDGMEVGIRTRKPELLEKPSWLKQKN